MNKAKLKDSKQRLSQIQLTSQKFKGKWVIKFSLSRVTLPVHVACVLSPPPLGNRMDMHRLSNTYSEHELTFYAEHSPQLSFDFLLVS